MRRSLFAFVVGCAGLFSAFCDAAEPVQRPLMKGPVHEAFAAPVKGSLLLAPISNYPQGSVQEGIPNQPSEDHIWIPGYWKFSEELGEFIWITGIWRLPPPQMQWVSGHWEQLQEGWVYIPGFWSHVHPSELQFIDDTPPDPIEEDVGDPPSDQYFWSSGYWHYSHSTHQYEWMPGGWYPSDPEWVLVPAHYVWTLQGYVFIPAYWDYPLQARAEVYAPIHFSGVIPAYVTFTPIHVIPFYDLIDWFGICYPDYLCHLHHHFHYHPGFWTNISWVPIWWHWQDWWCFNWHHHWGLWWWYSHPGYIPPPWMNPYLCSLIPPPHWQLLQMFQGIAPPIFVTPLGVLPLQNWLNVIGGQILGGHVIIKGALLPLIPKLDKKIGELKPKGQMDDLRPSGKKGGFDGRSPKKPGISLDSQPPVLRRPLPRPPLPNKPERPSLTPHTWPVHPRPLPLPPQDERPNLPTPPRQPWPPRIPKPPHVTPQPPHVTPQPPHLIPQPPISPRPEWGPNDKQPPRVPERPNYPGSVYPGRHKPTYPVYPAPKWKPEGKQPPHSQPQNPPSQGHYPNIKTPLNRPDSPLPRLKKEWELRKFRENMAPNAQPPRTPQIKSTDPKRDDQKFK